MKDVSKMTSKDRRFYIFEDNTSFEGRPHSKWITDCLLGDIRTFLEGIENRDESADGGGNLSVPILINTALEFVAELYTGKTENILCFSTDMNEELKNDWKEFKIDSLTNRLNEIIEIDEFDISKKDIKSISKSIIETEDHIIKKEGPKLNVYENYNATNNVIRFIGKYFPGEYKNIPNILWSGTRNGLVHTFYPTFFEYPGNCSIHFEFYVGDRDKLSEVILVGSAGPIRTSGDVRTVSSNVSSGERIDYNSSYETSYNTVIRIRINVFNMYKVLKEAIEKYLSDLDEKEELQENFINAWKSIEDNTRPIDPDDRKAREAGSLLSKLKNSNNLLLLQ